MQLSQPNWWPHSQLAWSQLTGVFQSQCRITLQQLRENKNWNKVRSGLSNFNYQLSFNQKKYFVQLCNPEQKIKLPGKNNYPIYRELHKQKKLRPWLVTCYYESEQLRVFNWVDSIREATIGADYLTWQTQLCEFMQQLHSSTIVLPCIDMTEHLKNYHQIAIRKEPGKSLKINAIYQRALACSQFYVADKCCHNDLSPENIICSERLLVIDWEYACIGDPIFDLAGVCCNFALTSEQENQLIQNYSEKMQVNINLKKFNKMKELYQLITQLWLI